MDGFNEKKWFVYLGDHHEGPFSLAEIQDKMSAGQVTSSNYVWAEGMPDWKAMTAVSAFDAVLNPSGSLGHGFTEDPAGSPTMVGSLEQGAMAEAQAEAAPAPVIGAKEDKTDDIDPETLKKVQQESKGNATVGLPGSVSVAGGKKTWKSYVKWLVLVLILAGGATAYMQGYLDPVINSPALKSGLQAAQDAARPYLLKVSGKVPLLSKWISPIPALDDVSPEDFEQLKAAASAPLDQGVKVAVALSKSDLFSPSFYVATNLPDGATLDVYVEGIPDTLLNRLTFSGKASGQVEKNLAKTSALRSDDGKPVQRGEYMLYVTESDSQPAAVKSLLDKTTPSPALASKLLPSVVPAGHKLLVKKSYFLGGNRDATYLARLKDFHDKQRAKADAEIKELLQFATTLDSQLSSTISGYTKYRSKTKPGKKPKITKAQMKGWTSFSLGWMKLETQLSETFMKWTDASLAADYFYGSIYKLVQKAAQDIDRVHGLQHSYFQGGIDPSSYDIQLGEAVSQANNSIAALKAKIEQAQRLGSTPNGLPRREGL